MASFSRGRAEARRTKGCRRGRWLLPLSLPILWLAALPARAESRTAESIWSQSDAQQRAIDQIPLADRDGISQTRCQEVGVGRMGSLPRFRCTVWFTPAAPATPAAP
jgi:hypothetical protein